MFGWMKISASKVFNFLVLIYGFVMYHTWNGDGTDVDIHPLELKSNALTTQPSWFIYYAALSLR